jgi:CheY-like chemotaxis protein
MSLKSSQKVAVPQAAPIELYGFSGQASAVQDPSGSGLRRTQRAYCFSLCKYASPSMPLPFEGLRILLVEDDVLVREMLRRHLGRRGVRLGIAGTAEDAVGLLDSGTWDLVLSDVDLGGASGLWLKDQVGRRLGPPVLLMTGGDLADLGPSDDVLPKPFSLNELDQRIALRIGRPVGAGAPLPGVDSHSLLAALPGVAYVTRQDRFAGAQFVSSYISQLLGIRQTEWLSDPGLWRRLIHPEDVERVLDAWASMEQTGQFACEYRMLGVGGRTVWVHDRAHTRGALGEPAQLAYGIMVDVSDHRPAQAAHDLTDVVTGVYSRAAFLALAEQQIRVSLRRGTPMLLLVATLEQTGSAALEDRVSRSSGNGNTPARDGRLVGAAHAFTTTFRRSDVIGRIAPDKLAVLAVETDLSRAELLAGRIGDNLPRTPRAPELALRIGAAEFQPAQPSSIDQLFATADKRGKAMWHLSSKN